MKKVLGAGKQQIVRQFITETFGGAFIAAIIAFGLCQLILPGFNNWFDKDVPAVQLTHPAVFVFLTGLVAFIALSAGWFPSVLLARLQPASTLQTKLKIQPAGQLPRQILTTLQLTISISLIASTLILQRQFAYMINLDLGFDKEQIMVLHTPPGIDSSDIPFRQALSILPGVKSISICQAAMSDGTFGSTTIPEGNNGQEIPVQMFRVDSNYLNTYGLELTEGRFLNRSGDFDPGAMIVNETLVKQIGWDEGIGKTLQFPGEETRYPIVGVVKDFYYNSLHLPVGPLAMYLDGRKSNISVRFDPQNAATLLPQIENLWNRFESRYPFDYYFLDEFFAQNYQKEKQMMGIIAFFAGIAIFIACLGLYGLTSFSLARRKKEIGIRKVLGASIPNILGLLTKNFLYPISVALLLGTPVTWYFLRQWLASFAYHVPLSWWVFLLAGVAMLAIVVITVSFQSFRAALANPVESLRSE